MNTWTVSLTKWSHWRHAAIVQDKPMQRAFNTKREAIDYLKSLGFRQSRLYMKDYKLPSKMIQEPLCIEAEIRKEG